MSNGIDEGDVDQNLAEEIQEGADAVEADKAKEAARKPAKTATAKSCHHQRLPPQRLPADSKRLPTQKNRRTMGRTFGRFLMTSGSTS
jgi:hypothetical protein